MERNVLVGGEVLLTHPSNACKGEYCTIHNNSNHHMRDWHQHWREDRHLIERICPHGVGHPDPDEINSDTTHGCDGCCDPSFVIEQGTQEMSEIANAIIDDLTVKMMLQEGYKDDGSQPTEWDPNIKDSQYSMVREIVEQIVVGTFEHISNYSDGEESQEEQEEVDDLFALPPRDKWGVFQMNKSKGAVKSSAHHFIFMDSGIGNPTYVRDVREWLRRVDELNIPDDQELEGTLHLSYDFDNTDVERIECGECYQHDIITATHHCDGRWSERYEVLKKQRESQQET